MGWTGSASPSVAARPELHALPVYSAPLASDTPVRVRASSNEAPDALSPAVREAVLRRLQTPNRYPVLGGHDLVAAIAGHLGADAEEVVAGDGSLSLLNYVLLTYCRPGHTVVHSWRSYEAYPICVRTAGAEPVAVPNAADGGHDLAAMAAAVDARTDAVIVCSPNNPTGVAIGHGELAAFLDTVPDDVLVVLDEAYRDFDDRPDAPRSRDLLAEHANLVVLRTFSKAYGLAALRIGYAIAHPQVVHAVRRILPPFPVNALASAAAVAALAEEKERIALVASILAQRTEVGALLDAHGLPHTPSHANFVWLPLGDRSEELGRLCAAEGISTRVFAGEGIRISLGEPGLLDALHEAVEAYAAAPARP